MGSGPFRSGLEPRRRLCTVQGPAGIQFSASRNTCCSRPVRSRSLCGRKCDYRLQDGTSEVAALTTSTGFQGTAGCCPFANLPRRRQATFYWAATGIPQHIIKAFVWCKLATSWSVVQINMADCPVTVLFGVRQYHLARI